MTRHIFSKGLKPALVVSSILSAGVVLSLPALAQMQTQTQTSSDIELSSDALEILCERFPLNSRCEGGATEVRDSRTSPESLDINESDPADAVSDPSDAPVQDAPEPMSGAPEMNQPSMGSDRLNPNESDPADAASDPSEAPVQDAPEPMSGSSYQTPARVEPGATQMPAPENGTVAPKQMSGLSKQTPATSDTTAPTAAGADALMAPESASPQAPEASSPEATEAEPQAPAAPSAETPAVEPQAPTAAETESSESGMPAASVTETELQKFAEAVPQLQAIERSTQQEVAQAIEESGFSRERFGQLYQQQTSGAAIEPVPTTDEQQSFTQAYSSIEKIQQDAQVEREQVITEQGLEPQRFDQILAAVLQDPSLQQQVQNMMAQ